MKEKNRGAIKKIIIPVVCILLCVGIVIFTLTIKGKNIKKYNIIFDTNGGTLVETFSVDENSTITKPENPTKENYDFAGWYYNDKLFDFSTPVTNDMKLEAKWTPVEKDSTMEEEKIENEIVKSDNIIVEKPKTEEKDEIEDEIIENEDNKTEENEKETFTITFLNYDGTVLEVKKEEVGEIPVYTKNVPIKPSDEQYTYTFVGWRPNLEPVERDAEYVAKYIKTLNNYTITFEDEDGIKLLEDQVIEHGNVLEKPEEPTKVGHKFVGWYNGETEYSFTEEITENIKLTAKWEKEKYTITFENYDGTVLETTTVEYGTVPTYTGENPTKLGDNVYTYEFAGWDKELVEVTENVTYTATYAEIYVEYEVKFVNEDGTEISKKIYHYGDTVEVPEEPTKAADVQYTYTFAGWSPAVTTVEGDATYTATYNKTLNSYTVKFVDENGERLAENQSVEYGSIAEEPEAPTKVGHKFVGWYNGETEYSFTEEITENIKLTAKWEKEKYTVTFENYDGTVLETKTEEYGVVPTYTGENPTKLGDNVYTYEFDGWDKELVEVTENITYTATYAEIYVEYEVKFVNEDGTEISKKIYHYGDTVEVPEEPTKAADVQYTYTFAGWSPAVTTVEGDATYTATYNKTLNSYTVKFVDENGERLAENQSVEYGSIAEEPEAPTKVGHNFIGWYNGETEYSFTEEVTENITLTAKWEKEKYTITFENYDGTVLETKTEEYGVVPTYTGENPTKLGDNVYTYEFDGWDKELVEVTENITYTATYVEIYVEYEVVFVNEDGTEISKKTYHYRDTVELPEEPTKAADVQYTYTFAGWSPSITTVKRDITYMATYTKTKNCYIVEFKDEDGANLAENQTIEYGSLAIEPVSPIKVGHKFIGWYNGETKYEFREEITGNITLTAKWEKEKYIVTFENYDGTVLEIKREEYGVVPTYSGEVPTKQGDNVYTYKFNGWNKQLAEVTENVTYTATYTKVYVEYEVKFVNEDGTEISKKTYHYGDTVEVPEEPTKVADVQYTYTFAGWSPAVTAVEGNTTYTAAYNKTLNSYTVKFVDENGEKLAENQSVEYGSAVEEPKAPTKIGHNFIGWYNGEIEYKFTEKITGNIILTAKWEKEKYTVTFENYDGTVLETRLVEYGAMPEYTKETPVRISNTEYEYIFIGWSPVITKVEKDTTYRAEFKFLVNVDKEVETSLASAKSSKFYVLKEENSLKAKFTSYTTTNIFGETIVKNPPYKFTDLFFDVITLFNSLSTNENYETFKFYYKHPGDSTGKTIDLKDYDLTDTSLGSWYGSGANDKVGDWIGYLATGEASTMAAYGANSDNLIGKTITATIKLRDGYVLEDGSDQIIYYITFVE